MASERPDVRAHKHNFPYELQDPTDENVKDLKKSYRGYLTGSIEVGPEKYFMQGLYKDFAQDIYDFAFKPSDVVVASFPKTGTTWSQEMVWLLVNNFNYSKAAQICLDDRFCFMEADCIIDRKVYEFEEVASRMGSSATPGPFHHLRSVHSLAEPRTIKTHMPFTLLPPDLLDTCKVIYVTRDPRDVIVSYYHHHQTIVSHGFSGSLEQFCHDFVEDKVLYAPFWSHVKEAWERRDHKNMLFITYEQMKKDLPSVIEKTAEFLGVSITPDQKDKLAAHLDFESMKNNPSVNGVDDPIIIPKKEQEGFIRKGQAGGWKLRFSDEMKESVSSWTSKNAAGLNEKLGWH